MSFCRRSVPVTPVGKRAARDPRDLVLKVANNKRGYQCRFCMIGVEYKHESIVDHLQKGAQTQHDQKLQRYLEACQKTGTPVGDTDMLNATAPPVVQRRRSSLTRQIPTRCNDSFAKEEWTIFRESNNELAVLIRAQNDTLHQMRIQIKRLEDDKEEAEKRHKIEMQAKDELIEKMTQRLNEHEAIIKRNRERFVEIEGILQIVRQDIVELSAQVEKYSAQVDQLNGSGMNEIMESIVHIAGRLDGSNDVNNAFYQEAADEVEEVHDGNNNEVQVNL